MLARAGARRPGGDLERRRRFLADSLRQRVSRLRLLPHAERNGKVHAEAEPVGATCRAQPAQLPDPVWRRTDEHTQPDQSDRSAPRLSGCGGAHFAVDEFGPPTRWCPRRCDAWNCCGRRQKSRDWRLGVFDVHLGSARRHATMTISALSATGRQSDFIGTMSARFWRWRPAAAGLGPFSPWLSPT